MQQCPFYSCSFYRMRPCSLASPVPCFPHPCFSPCAHAPQFRVSHAFFLMHHAAHAKASELREVSGVCSGSSPVWQVCSDSDVWGPMRYTIVECDSKVCIQSVALCGRCVPLHPRMLHFASFCQASLPSPPRRSPCCTMMSSVFVPRPTPCHAGC